MQIIIVETFETVIPSNDFKPITSITKIFLSAFIEIINRIRAINATNIFSSDHPEIAEIDINPIIITPEGNMCAVDALVIQKTKEKISAFLPSVHPDSVKSLFYPRSVAFVGASGQLGKWGYTLLTNTIGGGYEGEI